jgi:two-component system response regulator FixJ
MSGLELMRHISQRSYALPVILITGHGDVDMAVAAMKEGAFDFIEKPFDETRLLTSVEEATETRRQNKSATAELDELQTRFNALSERQREGYGTCCCGAFDPTPRISKSRSEAWVRA